jgi:hypothetical protein
MGLLMPENPGDFLHPEMQTFLDILTVQIPQITVLGGDL